MEFKKDPIVSPTLLSDRLTEQIDRCASTIFVILVISFLGVALFTQQAILAMFKITFTLKGYRMGYRMVPFNLKVLVKFGLCLHCLQK